MGQPAPMHIDIHPNGVQVIDNIGEQAFWLKPNEVKIFWRPYKFDPRLSMSHPPRPTKGSLASFLTRLTKLWLDKGDMPVLSWRRGRGGTGAGIAKLSLKSMVQPGPNSKKPWVAKTDGDLRAVEALVVEA